MVRLAFVIADHTGRALFFRHDLSGLPKKTDTLVMLIFAASAAFSALNSGVAWYFPVHMLWLFSMSFLFSVRLTVIYALLSIAIDGLAWGLMAGFGNDFAKPLGLWEIACLIVLMNRDRKLKESSQEQDNG